MNYYRISLFTLALVGLLVSSYLLLMYVAGGPIKCYGGHGCDTVRASIYSAFWGIPTPAFGVGFYALLAAGALLMGASSARWLKYALLLVTGIGFIVSAYLSYLEAFVIDAWCWWCVVSAIVATLAWLLVWWHEGAHLSGKRPADMVRII